MQILCGPPRLERKMRLTQKATASARHTHPLSASGQISRGVCDGLTVRAILPASIPTRMAHERGAPVRYADRQLVQEMHLISRNLDLTLVEAKAPAQKAQTPIWVLRQNHTRVHLHSLRRLQFRPKTGPKKCLRRLASATMALMTLTLPLLSTALLQMTQA